MTKQAETTAEALRHYGAPEEIVVEALRLLNAGETHVTVAVHTAAHYALIQHEKAYGAIVARLTPMGDALQRLLAMPFVLGQDRRNDPPSPAPAAPPKPARPTLTLPKRRSVPRGPTSNPKEDS